MRTTVLYFSTHILFIGYDTFIVEGINHWSIVVKVEGNIEKQG
jgi:hypothetical protein